jgi:steroid delta-isomerase-like uncharacterized protein
MKQTIAVTVLCVTMVLMGAPVRAKTPQSQCAQISQKWADFWNGRDFAPAFDVFTKDVVYEDVPTVMGASGAKEFRAFAQGFFDAFPTTRFELGQSACHGQEGFIEWTWIGEDGRVEDPLAPGFCGTGKPFMVRGVAVIEIKGHRISRNADYWDFATVLRQLLPEGQDCVARLLGFRE